MTEPVNEYQRSLLTAFDESLAAIDGLRRLASGTEKKVGEYGAQQSTLAVIGHL